MDNIQTTQALVFVSGILIMILGMGLGVLIGLEISSNKKMCEPMYDRKGNFVGTIGSKCDSKEMIV